MMFNPNFELDSFFFLLIHTKWIFMLAGWQSSWFSSFVNYSCVWRKQYQLENEELKLKEAISLLKEKEEFKLRERERERERDPIQTQLV